MDQYRFLARYNAWFNQRLYDACEQLSEPERQRGRAAFFGSLQATLEHILWGDKVWLARFAAQGVDFPMLGGGLLDLPASAANDRVLHLGWAELRRQRQALDAAIEEWTAQMPPGFALSVMQYANTQGVQRAHPAWQALTHFFNHQTHHRGQATALLMQAGVDVGVTDLIALV